MKQELGIPRRSYGPRWASLLLISVLLACSCRAEPDQQALRPLPSSPAATDSGAVPPVATEPVPIDSEGQAEQVPQDKAEEPVDESQTAMPEEAGKTAAADQPDVPQVDPPETDLEQKLDFGKPLVEGLGKNELLDPKDPIWLTRDRKSVIMQSMVCQRQAPLEMFACLYGSKEHESVLTVPVKANVVHTGLLAAGAKSGTPVRWDPEYAPPTGTEIEITVLWKDEQGKVQKARAQDWVKDLTTGKAMTHPWVFAGSRMHKDEETGREHYMGDSSGDLICVSNFSTATLDVPVQSSDSNASLMFEAFTEHIPPLGTPVTIVLTPKLADQDSPGKSD
ncbi:MAG: hypothetical protein GXX96_19895 [Planctomycetaceae bacterium]|nr:hypothetical protein [Planctomycetaceae bacterium]